MKYAWCFALAFGTLFSATPAQGQLRVEVDREHVTVRDVAAGDKVAIVGVVQEFPGDTMHVRTPFLIGEDEDRDGEVSLGATASVRSTLLRGGFVAVELSSGRNAIGMSEGTRRNIGTSARAVVTDERTPQPYAVTLRAREATIMFVRPGAGAWRQVIRDGGSSDGDGRGNGLLVIEPASFVRATDVSSPPTTFQDGDLLAAINTTTREIQVIDVGALFAKALGEED